MNELWVTHGSVRYCLQFYFSQQSFFLSQITQTLAASNTVLRHPELCNPYPYELLGNQIVHKHILALVLMAVMLPMPISSSHAYTAWISPWLLWICHLLEISSGCQDICETLRSFTAILDVNMVIARVSFCGTLGCFSLQ